MAKSVLITGGAKRLGQEMALSLAEKNWAIALHYRNSLEEAESTRKKIEEAGSECKLFSADLENHKKSTEFPEAVKGPSEVSQGGQSQPEDVPGSQN